MDEHGQLQFRLHLNVDDSELENLEVLNLYRNSLENDQLYNLAKFKKLHTLNISENKVDLTHIHNITSLTKLTMGICGLKNIELISSLVNLKDLDISYNNFITDIVPLHKLNSLTTLSLRQCDLMKIDQIAQLTTLEVLDISDNQLYTIDSIRFLVNLKELNISSNMYIDINPLKDLVGLIKLNMKNCNLKQLRALKPLINLQDLDLSFNYNYNINISELQYVKNLTHLNLFCCNLVSIYVLRPLVNLEELNVKTNNIVYLDADPYEMKKLEKFSVDNNRVIDLSSIEQHPNYNNINENGWRTFYLSDQKEPSEEELRKANKLRKIESPNIQLKEIQNQHKALKTALNNVKQEINATISNAWQSKIQFTANVVRLFQLLNKFGFE
ncbi:leucine-rich_repeat domain-containing protein [Hexamita inflata]|uniref:Leucine-rich repeat domain-containing protein n=1 Tax=Hexamita inflata TaxID=28002 RepID=A0AA86RUV9_9EUKA|nr:leucine-rich repeat domain-containing protein [Hexamita inflata]